MPIFPRRGENILDGNGCTQHRNIRFSNAAQLEVFGGYGPFIPNRHPQFRLKFSNGDEGDGWLVDMDCLDELVAELLYIKAEIMHARGVEQDDGPGPL